MSPQDAPLFWLQLALLLGGVVAVVLVLRAIVTPLKRKMDRLQKGQRSTGWIRWAVLLASIPISLVVAYVAVHMMLKR